MGFLSGLTGGGGSSTSKSGWAALGKTMKYPFQNVARGINEYIFTGKDTGKINTDQFTPMAMTPDEQQAFDIIRQGFAPTEQSLSSDMSMLQNPFNQYVTDEINRQSGGEYSLLKQAMSEAGQFGSNRQVLGAGEIENTRLRNVGQFNQDQYNKNLQYIMSNLPALRAADAQGLLGIGEFQRDLDWRTKNAGVTGLQTAAGLLSSLPTDGGNITTQKSGGGGLLSGLSSVASLAGSFFAPGAVIPAGATVGPSMFDRVSGWFK